MDKNIAKPSAADFRNSMESFLSQVMSLIGQNHVERAGSRLEEASQNSLGKSKVVPAVIFPRSTSEVQAIVRMANQYEIQLYPISRGQNIGYGGKTPWRDRQVVVSLERMTAILDFDPEAGEVTVEPGVTQKQLFDFLRVKGGDWIADVTGAPTASSIMGNTLDGGFGHTPLGNHREHILEIEAVLGTGELLRTGRFPTLGPNMAPLFIQSNFGIVTSLRIPLMKRPENVLTYTVQFYSQANFDKALPIIRQLKHERVIESLVHIGNAVRLCMSTRTFPKTIPKSQRLSEEDCLKLMKLPLVKPALWTAVGGIYGSRARVQESARKLRKAFKGLARVQIFDEKKFAKIERLVKWVHSESSPHREPTLNSIRSLKALHGLAQGIPTDEPFKNILWRTDSIEDMGLIWCSPVIEASNQELNRLISIVKPIFEKHRFELPITTTLVDHKHLVCVLNLSFDKSTEEERQRAHGAYQELSEALKKANIGFYRLSLLSSSTQIPEDRLRELRGLKRLWDPNGVIAPGRYGI